MPLLLALLLTAAPAPVPPLETEARAVLDELLAVDTSHGNESRALEKVKARFAAVGLPSQLLESAPGRGNLVARIKGNGTKRPLLLLAHIDVVPVEGQSWTSPPFVPVEREGFLYARGVSDDKAMAAAIVAIALELQRKHTVLARDVIIALTAGEETGGDAGAKWLVQTHRALIDAELALNEGGGQTLSADGQRVESVGVQTAEKTFQTFHLAVKGPGGHSSVPPQDNPVTTLARALVRLGDLKTRAHVIPEVKPQLLQAASHEQGELAAALKAAGTGTLSAHDEAVLSADRIYNAFIRTTCVATMLEGAPQDNVLPTVVGAAINCRILPDESIDAVQALLARTIDDPRVELTQVTHFGPGGISPLRPDVEQAVRHAAQQEFGDAPVVTTISAGGTDSRQLRQVGIAAFGVGVAPGTLDDQRKGFGAHGANERRATRWLAPGVRFLRAVTLELAR
jgi:acetylornithine deacetylase/succinyl-diaminopimelate desuccinylase-like protein